MNTLNREDLNHLYLEAKKESLCYNKSHSLKVFIDSEFGEYPTTSFVIKCEFQGYFLWIYVCTYGLIFKPNLHPSIDLSVFQAKAEDLFDMIDSEEETIIGFLWPIIHKTAEIVDLSCGLKNGCFNGQLLEGDSYITLGGDLVGPLTKRLDGRFTFETRTNIMNFDVDGRYLTPGNLSRANCSDSHNISYNTAIKLDLHSKILLADDSIDIIIEKISFTDGTLVFKSSNNILYNEKGLAFGIDGIKIVSTID